MLTRGRGGAPCCSITASRPRILFLPARHRHADVPLPPPCPSGPVLLSGPAGHYGPRGFHGDGAGGAGCRRGGARLSEPVRLPAGAGISELLLRTDPADSLRYCRRPALQKLLSPAEMGELFKVLLIGRREPAGNAAGAGPQPSTVDRKAQWLE
jgi:hypothetical protein